ncbi:L-seryl-tRNA(Sec) selenium transferase [Scopulibacillus darangshiensis]|uniref:L-seryl-tRNA(Sec) selenium transferase n=1 Tax=Scopulibacillus darangshiensis TaxID=442528 RepID=A0A4R2P5U2_9BACL|nr:L-seryl-tRNA(Sec) selenium transferase [Scopulibacillus darangshiensis]TCP30182.1 L-seryl-tRNA(Sec) selenium transferase [Scopulibacillus darangshiensis]
MVNPLSYLPSIKAIQNSDIFQFYTKQGISADYLTILARETVEEARIMLKGTILSAVNQDDVHKQIYDLFSLKAGDLLKPGLRRVINGTGVILHTNLGRARLSRKAAEAVYGAAMNYTNLEFDLETGERGLRYDHIEEQLTKLTGAESAMVVNNNAAAVFFILRAFAKQREVIVSRGELVEIGGSFRVSSIMEESDARLIEVGTTNKTHGKDFLEAMGERTAMVMKVHQSNFNMVGFTSSVSRKRLAEIARNNKIIFYEDLGSGAFFNFQKYGIGHEPVVKDILQEGPDLISCSGDKLFGGPQAGIILGKKTLIDRLKKHQLARTLRVDKFTLAALSATIQSYFSNERLVQEIPTVHHMLEGLESVGKRAEDLCGCLKTYDNMTVKIIEATAKVGGGTMPDVSIDSYAVAIKHRYYSADQLAAKLRCGTPAIVGRIQDGLMILDLRTMTKAECDDVSQVMAVL